MTQDLYVVISAKTKQIVMVGLTLNDASRYCRVHPGHYLTREV